MVYGYNPPRHPFPPSPWVRWSNPAPIPPNRNRTSLWRKANHPPPFLSGDPVPFCKRKWQKIHHPVFLPIPPPPPFDSIPQWPPLIPVSRRHSHNSFLTFSTKTDSCWGARARKRLLRAGFAGAAEPCGRRCCHRKCRGCLPCA